jgi:hypothetical protein
MKKQSVSPTLALLLGGAVLLGGCSAARTQGVSASWAKAYPTLQELTQDADAILVGRVEKSTPASAVDGIPFTDATVAVKTWLKGKEAASTITVKQTGGAVPGASVSVVDPLMQPGESSMLFLHKNDDGTYTALSGPTGRLLVSGTAVTKMSDTSLAEAIPETLPALIAEIKLLL